MTLQGLNISIAFNDPLSRCFNRTSVELKLEGKMFGLSGILAFNRTSVELKRDAPDCRVSGWNRTQNDPNPQIKFLILEWDR